MIEAISIIEVYTVRGLANRLEAPLSALVSHLQNTAGSISYHAVQSPANSDLWVLTGQWESKKAMEDHYDHPALSGVMTLLGCNTVTRMSVSSFLKSNA
ncbi:antibiotic biosynthesis monooxygenase family protein [Pseudomonas sp. NPDC090202]|uniref:antibiotic biosynthesis monooxygenase family protein n=1 Tax=unclassified Pseudomonas TaxID=196821 RepID=UPI0037F8FFD1